MSTPQDDASSLNSLKERMMQAAPPEERAMSAAPPAGSWLDGLRTSFDPASGGQPEPKPGLLVSRLRSV